MADCTRCGATNVAVQTTMGDDAYCDPCMSVLHPPRWQDSVLYALSRTTTGMSAGEPVTEVYRPEGLVLFIEDALRIDGFRVVHPNHMAEDCQDPWVCCIHTPPETNP